MWPHPRERPCTEEINSNRQRDRLVQTQVLAIFPGMLLFCTQRWQTDIFVLWVQSRRGLASGTRWCLRGGCSGRCMCMEDADVKCWCFQMLLQQTQEVKLEKGCVNCFFCIVVGAYQQVWETMAACRCWAWECCLGYQIILDRHILTA